MSWGCAEYVSLMACVGACVCIVFEVRRAKRRTCVDRLRGKTTVAKPACAATWLRHVRVVLHLLHARSLWAVLARWNVYACLRAIQTAAELPDLVTSAAVCLHRNFVENEIRRVIVGANQNHDAHRFAAIGACWLCAVYQILEIDAADSSGK